jgi:Lar family restriction alleviation protein
MSAPELKPCPFCGSDAVQLDFDACPGTDSAHVRCQSCSALGASGALGSVPEAIVAWNTRAEAGVVRELVEALLAWRAWEAKLILDNRAWVNGEPRIPQELWDEYAAIAQQKREAALAKAGAQ